MADISSIPFINFGGQQAQQAQSQSAANLQNQQAQAAAMQNQIMAAKLPFMLQLYKQGQDHITDFSGQTNGHPNSVPDYDAASDASGSIPQGAPGQNRVTAFDMIGRDGKTTSIVQGAVQGKYNVNKMGTDAEQQAISDAYHNKEYMTLYGDEGMKASAEARLQGAINARDMAVSDRTNSAQLDASQNYETLAAAHEAPHPFQALTAINPAAAARLKAANPNASDADLDQAAQNSIGSTAAFLHRFTGRATEKGDDGIYRDKDTGLPVSGVVPAGFNAEDIEKIRQEGLTKTTKTVDGRDVSKFNYEWAGFHNPDQYVQNAIGQARSYQQSQSKIEQKRQGAVAIQAQAGVPPDQRIPSPGQTTPASAASSAALRRQQPPAAAAQSQGAARTAGTAPMTLSPTTVGGPPAPATGASPGTASSNAPSGNLDLSDIQRSKTPNTPGAGLPAGAAPSATDTEDWKQVQAKNAEEGQTSSGAPPAIQIATNARNALKADAATGNTAASRTALAVALGNPASLRTILGDATSSSILRKMLGNAAFEQLETDANGNSMRLGSQTIRVAMTQLSASPEMTPQAIQALTGQMIKNASYEKQKANDYATYKGAGGDVTDFDRWYSNKYPNKTSIDTGNDTIRVTHPTKGAGTIPASQWEKAQKLGYKKAE